MVSGELKTVAEAWLQELKDQRRESYESESLLIAREANEMTERSAQAAERSAEAAESSAHEARLSRWIAIAALIVAVIAAYIAWSKP